MRRLGDRLALLVVALLPLTLTAVSQRLHLVLTDSIGGMPYSDANGWAVCAHGISAVGRFTDVGADWCMRRPAYPYLLGSLESMVGSLAWALFLVAILAGALFAWLFHEALLRVGRLWALALGTLSLLLWAVWGTNRSLSESLGLPLAAGACAALLRALRTGRVAWIFASTGLLAWAEQVRPTNQLLILMPLIFIAPHEWKRFRMWASAFVSALLPYAATALRSHQLGYVEAGQGGNGWATVYGFATGNRPWPVVAEVPGYASALNESQRWTLVREAALHALASHPSVAVQAFVENIWSLATNAWLVSGFGALGIVLTSIVSLAYWGALARAVRNCWRRGETSTALAALVVSLVALSTWALILPARIEGLRVMTSAVLLLATTHALTFSESGARPWGIVAQARHWEAGAIVSAAAVFVALIFAPWQAQSVLPRNQCPRGSYLMVADTEQTVSVATLTYLHRAGNVSTTLEAALSSGQLREDSALTQGLAITDGQKTAQVQYFGEAPAETSQSHCVMVDAHDVVLGYSRLIARTAVPR